MSYFKMIQSLMKLFCVLSVMATLQMILFGSVDGLGHINEKLEMYVPVSFANMGFPKPICTKEIL